MQTASFESSVIRSAEREDNDLYIRFPNGDIYKYKNAGRHLEPLTQAKSAGRYFNGNIRNSYDAVLVG